MNDGSKSPRGAGAASAKPISEPLLERIFSRLKNQASLDDANEESHADDRAHSPDETTHERRLLSNVVAFRTLSIADVMVPRAEILAVEASIEFSALLTLVAEHTHSRLPVYRETLDNVIGAIHIKDLITVIALKKEFDLAALVRPVPFVSPSMRTTDLLLEMRRNRTHMALVIDEFGGIDGLVTIEDLIEEIVGEIEDEHDRDHFSEIIENEDGTLTVDARMPIEDFEERFGSIVGPEEREEFDTVGGLIWSLAGHIPAKGEIVSHEAGAEFEVLDADQHRIKRVRARRLPFPHSRPLTQAAS
jgi:CBS domain containing-hemolysin-like protein